MLKEPGIWRATLAGGVLACAGAVLITVAHWKRRRR